MVVALRPDTAQDTVDQVDQRLEAYWPLIKAAAWSWADPRRQDHEDLVQEAALAVWRLLQQRPDAPVALMRLVAEHAARDSLCRGRSIERPLVQGKKGSHPKRNPWAFGSLEAIQEDKRRWQAFEARVVSQHRGDLPRPTEELVVAWVMYEEIWNDLTPRQRSVLGLRYQGFTRPEIAARLHLSETRLHYIIAAIQNRAQCLWAEPEPSTCAVCGVPITQTPHVSRRRMYCSNACKVRAYKERKKLASATRPAQTGRAFSLAEAWSKRWPGLMAGAARPAHFSY